MWFCAALRGNERRGKRSTSPCKIRGVYSRPSEKNARAAIMHTQKPGAKMNASVVCARDAKRDASRFRGPVVLPGASCPGRPEAFFFPRPRCDDIIKQSSNNPAGLCKAGDDLELSITSPGGRTRESERKSSRAPGRKRQGTLGYSTALRLPLAEGIAQRDGVLRHQPASELGIAGHEVQIDRGANRDISPDVDPRGS